MPTTNTNQSDDGIVEVTKADRDAAWPFRPSPYRFGASAAWGEGRCDAISLLQAFARHRIAEQERCAKVLTDAETPRRRWVKRDDCLAAIRQTGEQG
jgi:hypothetical protein